MYDSKKKIHIFQFIPRTIFDTNVVFDELLNTGWIFSYSIKWTDNEVGLRLHIIIIVADGGWNNPVVYISPDNGYCKNEISLSRDLYTEFHIMFIQAQNEAGTLRSNRYHNMYTGALLFF